MKCILALLVVSVLPIGLAAQQPETDACSGVNFSSPKPEVMRCLELQRQKAKESAEKLKKADEALEEAKRIADDERKLHSGETNAQIDGVVDVAKDVNSHANSNPYSKEVVKQGLSVMDRVAHGEAAITEQTKEDARIASQTEPGSSSSFSATEKHQLNESTKEAVGTPQLTVEQRIRRNEQVMTSTPSTGAGVRVSDASNVVNTTQSTVQQRIQSNETGILASSSAVRSVIQGDQAVEAMWQARREIEARKEEQHRKELADQAAAVAEAKQLAEQERREKLHAEAAEEDREERAEAAREARAERAAWNAMFGPPAVQTMPYAPYVPSYTPPVSSYGSYLPAYDPSYMQRNGSSGGYLGYDAARPTSGSNNFNAFSCMSNLSTERQCLRDNVKPIQYGPGCFDDPGSLAIPSCFGSLWGGAASTPAAATPPTADATATPALPSSSAASPAAAAPTAK